MTEELIGMDPDKAEERLKTGFPGMRIERKEYVDRKTGGNGEARVIRVSRLSEDTLLLVYSLFKRDIAKETE